MNIRDSYIHGADGKGVVKTMYFATSAETVYRPDFSATYNTVANRDLIFLLADTLGTKIGITIPTLNQNTTGYASQLLVVKRAADANHYLTFVDSNNNSATAESFYTDGDITYNPSTNLLTVGKITISSLLNYSNIQAATDSVDRPIWLSSTNDAKGTPVYNSGFYFNPGEGPVGNTGTLHVNNISGQNIAINIGDPTNGGTRVVIGGTYNPVTTINSSSTNLTIPGTKAVYDAILNGIAVNDAMIFKGVLNGGNTAANTTYTPAADCGHVYKVATAGYINGDYYNVNDTFICTTDSTAAATSSTSDADMTTIKSRWGVVEGNGDYLSIAGGTMRGSLKWADASALPSTTAADYILVVDATSNGTTKYITKANFKTALSITDKTAFKLHTNSGNPGTTLKTDGTVISANSSTALSIKGGTNSFTIGNGTNYITIPVAHGLSTKNITINGTRYAVYTSESSLPTFVAPGSYAGTGGYILATNSAKNGLEWVAKPVSNVTTTAVVSSTTSGTTQVASDTNNPYYNLIEGGAVVRSIQFAKGTNMTSIVSNASGVITFSAADTWRGIRVNSGNSDSVGTDNNTKSMNFASSNLNIGYLAAGTGTGKSGSADYFTINIEAKAWGGATSDTAGTAGYMPGAAAADRLKFLRGDGTWVALSSSDHTHPLSIAADSGTNQLTLAASTKYKLTAGGKTFVFTTPPNTWRNIRVNNGSSDSVDTGVGTKAMNFTATGNLEISYKAAGTGNGQSGSADYFTINVNAKANAVGIAGYVAAPTAANNKNQVWMTDASGVPAWRTISLNSAAQQLFNGAKTLTVSSWTTIAAVNTLEAGTYAISISSETLYASGIFTSCHGTDVMIDEIVLHVSNSTSGQTWRPYARISGNNLEMSSNESSGTQRTYTVKILKLI